MKNCLDLSGVNGPTLLHLRISKILHRANVRPQTRFKFTLNMFNVNNKDTGTTQVASFWHVFIVNFEHISDLVSSVSIVNPKHVIAGARTQGVTVFSLTTSDLRFLLELG